MDLSILIILMHRIWLFCAEPIVAQRAALKLLWCLFRICLLHASCCQIEPGHGTSMIHEFSTYR